MKRILLPIDFSENAQFAANAAASIASQTGAELIVLHIYENSDFEDDQSNESNSNKKDVLSIERKLHGLFESNFTSNLNYNLNLTLPNRNIWNTILNEAENSNVDLIVMGAYGSDGKKELWIGSNTEKVMRLSEIPVLIIKDEYKKFEVNNMVFASVFYGEVYDVFHKVKDFASHFDTTIHLLKVVTPTRFQSSDDIKKLMKDFQEAFNLQNCTENVYCDATIEEGVNKFANEINADLIALTTHGERRLNHLVSKNITDEILKDSVKAILSVRISQPPPLPFKLYLEAKI